MPRPKKVKARPPAPFVPPPPVINDGMKTCTGACGQELPATSDYFDRDETRDDGLRSVCKACRAQERQVSQYQAIDERVRNMDEAAMNLLQHISRGGSSIPHVSELYENIMQAFEGAGGYAAHFMAQYLMAKPGSTTRTKMLELTMRLGIISTELGSAQQPVDAMADEDLQVAFRTYVNRYAPRLAHYEHGDAKEAS